ncbi:MAG: ATP-grasp domain-containing protein [Paracoccaceae bacterium]
MTVYILAQDDRVGSLNRRAAVLGFQALGEEVREFEDVEFDDLPLEREDIVVGGISYARRAFTRLGLEVAHLDPIPQALLPFAGRRIWQDTMGQVRSRVNAGETLFVKPAPDRPKSFDGAVLSTFRDLIPTAHLADDLIVDCAEPVNFLSEYRTFIRHGDVISVRPYKGEPLVFPDPDMIRNVVAAFAEGPAAYALDVGVTEDGRSLIVEINDAYACGAYGLFPIQYAMFIRARWEELWRVGQLRQG